MSHIPFTRSTQSPCPVCGRHGDNLYRNVRDVCYNTSGGWDIIICKSCDLTWLGPTPTPMVLAEVYKDYPTHSSVCNPPNNPWFHYLRQSILMAGFGYSPRHGSRFIGRLLGIGPLKHYISSRVRMAEYEGGGDLLDVGCGNGRYLSEMRNLGWRVKGIEPDANAANVAKTVFGEDVMVGTLEDSGIPDESFDLISMNHVIEHLPDPVRTIRHCYRLLKPNGRLVVITPNIHSFCERVFGINWSLWAVPAHIHCFSRKSLASLASTAGFKEASTGVMAGLGGDIWLQSTLIRDNSSLPGGITPQGIGAALKWQKYFMLFFEHLFLRYIGMAEAVWLQARKV